MAQEPIPALLARYGAARTETDEVVAELAILAQTPAGGEVPPPPEGPPPGAGNRRVFDRRTYNSTLDPGDFNDTDWVDCVSQTGKEPALFGKPGRGNRFFNHRIEGLRLEEPEPGRNVVAPIYLNAGHKEDSCRLLFQGLSLRDTKAGHVAEFKGCGWTIDGLRQEDDCTMPGGIRIRIGKGNAIKGARGLKKVTARGWLHEVVDCPGASVLLYAGNLPARYEQWEDLHVAGGGENMQCCELAYIEGVGSVVVGYVSEYKKYPALNCVVHPAQQNVTLGVEKGTKRATYEEWLALAREAQQ